MTLLDKLVKKQSYAWALFIIILGSGLILAQSSQYLAIKELKNKELAIHQVLATSLANAIGTQINEFLSKASTSNPALLLSDPAMPELQKRVAKQLVNIPIAKLKVYDPNAATIFSTDTTEIGPSKGTQSLGFVEAMSGKTVGELVLTGTKGELTEAAGKDDLAATLVPIYDKPGAPPFAVIEVQTSVSRAILEIQSQSQNLGMFLTLAGLIVYMFTLLVLRKAERHQREHDPITGLSGRKVCLRTLESKIGPRTKQQSFGIIQIGIDKFSSINSGFGHHVGDALLKEVALRIRAVHPAQNIFKIDGVSFICIFDVSQSQGAHEIVVKKVLKCFDESFTIEGKELALAASAGLALWLGEEPEVMLKRASAALATAKTLGPGRWVEHSKSQENTAQNQVLLVTELKKAIKDGDFIVYYQPLVDCKTGKVLSLEALVRWKHPQKGLVAPGVFIPALEESGLIVPVGAWVLEQACLDCSMLRKKFNPNLRMAVNLSAKQFNVSNILQTVQSVLTKTSLPSEALDLEVTESAIAMDPEQAIRVLHRLQELGVSISIDDFGTGYSSLSMLRRLPLNTLKIDRSFINDAPTNKDAATICRAIASLAKNLDLQIVAEGIETQEQLWFSQQIGVDKVQGYYFSKPLSIEQLDSFLSKYQPKLPAPIK